MLTQCRRRIFLIIILLTAVSRLTFAEIADDSFLMAGHVIAPGKKEHITVPITASDGKTVIPITVIRGRENGMTLAMTAGIHGFEYPPILASQDLAKSIDPDRVSGTIIIVHLADVSAFLAHSPFINPVDGKNLNRAFPGDHSGTLTEAIAAFITENIIVPADVFVDLHGGDASEDLSHYAAFYLNPNKPDLSDACRTLANNTGFNKIIGMQVTAESLDHKSRYCSYEAFQQGKPTIDIECGKLGTANLDDVALIKNAMFNLMIHLQMMPGKPLSVTEATLEITQRASTISPVQGVFYPEKRAGDRVEVGMRLGYITDLFGQKIMDIEANSSGIILIMVNTPPVNVGDTLAVIGQTD